jgi:intron-binding protein aquarius
MEEAAQVLEVETLIPILLQQSSSKLQEASRLRRIILIGDHYQLPPIVQHLYIQKYAKLEQSMFTRFVRLNVPFVLLDKQGRARPDIAALYSWRYNNIRQSNSITLGNLDSIYDNEMFKFANAGFKYTFQVVNVENYKGRGEMAPTPFYYQNLGEAEYIVAVYQYMRLIGYPKDKISILTTYNGQKSLIRDIINYRCSKNPLFGNPRMISTVDKYQGQQNDFILLSMVRTESIGHVRDIRRLIVLLSRARLGLYIFCRVSLFQNCFELSNIFNILLKNRPSVLTLVQNERFDECQREVKYGNDAEIPALNASDILVNDVAHMGMLVYQMGQARLQHFQGIPPPGPPTTKRPLSTEEEAAGMEELENEPKKVKIGEIDQGNSLENTVSSEGSDHESDSD